MQAITITQISPEELTGLIEAAVKRAIEARQDPKDEQSGDTLLTVNDAAAFLDLSAHSVYRLISKSLIPHMKRGKRVYFSKEELTNWLKSHKRHTGKEAAYMANTYLNTKGGNR